MTSVFRPAETSDRSHHIPDNLEDIARISFEGSVASCLSVAPNGLTCCNFSSPSAASVPRPRRFDGDRDQALLRGGETHPHCLPSLREDECRVSFATIFCVSMTGDFPLMCFLLRSSNREEGIFVRGGGKYFLRTSLIDRFLHKRRTT